MFSVSCWFNTGYMLRQFTEAFLVQTAENCGVSAVAVLHGRRFLVVVQRPIPMVLVTMENPQLRVDTVIDSLCCRSCSSLS